MNLRSRAVLVGLFLAAVALAINIGYYVWFVLRPALAAHAEWGALEAMHALADGARPPFSTPTWCVLNLPASALYVFCVMMYFGEALGKAWAILPPLAFVVASSAQWFALGAWVGGKMTAPERSRPGAVPPPP